MIATTTELNEVLKLLIAPIDCKIHTFSKKMSSQEANEIFRKLESVLDELYVKTRYLEDLRVFAESYIQNEFKKKSINFNKAVKAIREAGDDYEDTTNISHEIPFNSCTAVLTDRDGRSVRNAEIIANATILMANEELNSASADIVQSTSSDIPYRTITTPANHYRSFYVLTNPAPQGITEKLQILFRQPITANFVRAVSFKSSIVDMALIRTDNQLISTNKDVYGIAPQNIKGIQLTLTSNAFDRLYMEYEEGEENTSLITNKTERPASMLNTIFEIYTENKEGNYVSK